MKCNDVDCVYHQTIRLYSNTFSSLSWLPTARRCGDRNKDFDESYGDEPDDADQPSR